MTLEKLVHPIADVGAAFAFYFKNAICRIGLLAIFIIWVVASLMNIQIPAMVERATLAFIDLTSRETLRQIKDVRDTYAETVAKGRPGQGPRTALRGGEPTHVPLPIEFMKSITAQMSGQDVKIRVASPFPWPAGQREPMDSFLKDVWKELRSDPDAVVSRREGTGTNATYHVAIADRMISNQCVQCHNEHRDSPIRNWSLGDVRGILSVTTKVGPSLVSAQERTRIIQTWLWATCVITTILMLFAMEAVHQKELAKKKAHDDLVFLAHHDAMTGVLNREAFHRRLKMMMSKTKNPIQAVFFVDLDHFKMINDDYGHDIGDAMIKHLAKILVHHVSHHGFVGRVGGDEFMIALQSKRSLALAETILESLARPSHFEGQTLSMSASIGIAKASNPRQSCDEWIRQADLAVYKAKTDGRSRYVVYDKSLDEAAIEAKRVEAVLRDAIETETLDVHFQPIWNIQNGSLVGFEALARLNDPMGGMISPAIFIPIAEKNQQIHQVGEIIMRRSCVIAATWENPVRISVNISPAQMTAKRRMTDFVGEALRSSGLAPERLEIEITEGILLDQNEDVMNDLREIQKKGTRIVIDDFGAGYSGISYFWKFPFDKIKLDRSLVQGEEVMDGAKTATLKTIMELARQFSMEVVGEGVETAEDLEFLKTLGCHQAQGYLLGRPMNAAKAATLARLRTSTENAPSIKSLRSFAA